MIETFQQAHWDQVESDEIKQKVLCDLENGHVLYFPMLPFLLAETEQTFLSPHLLDPDSKNIGYDATHNRLWGVRNLEDVEHLRLKSLMDRYSRAARALVHALFPAYEPHLILGRTSFRPVEVSNRQTSYRKDDKRLHVDAFPSAPNQGKRILRVFSNINQIEDRVWRLGESFESVVEQFLPTLTRPVPGKAALLRFLKVTKSYRSAYDHYMLYLHDSMKANETYQKNAAQQEVRFKPGTTWIVQTDHVSHAAMAGQHLLEQTFYLPVTAMQNQALSPLRVLERRLNKALI